MSHSESDVLTDNRPSSSTRLLSRSTNSSITLQNDRSSTLKHWIFSLVFVCIVVTLILFSNHDTTKERVGEEEGEEEGEEVKSLLERIKSVFVDERKTIYIRDFTPIYPQTALVPWGRVSKEAYTYFKRTWFIPGFTEPPEVGASVGECYWNYDISRAKRIFQNTAPNLIENDDILIVGGSGTGIGPYGDDVCSRKKVLAASYREIQIVFFRHGHSYWNELGLFPLLKYMYWPGSDVGPSSNDDPALESKIVDSPLSQAGIEDAVRAQHMSQDEVFLNAKKIKFVASNLRRAYTTLALGFLHCFFPERFLHRGETQRSVLHGCGRENEAASKVSRIQIHSALQEITCNIDSYSSIQAKKVPRLSEFEKKNVFTNAQVSDLQQVFQNFDVSTSFGNKKVGEKAIDRILLFTQWVFDKHSDDELIVVGGHSLFFKKFIQAFLHDSEMEKFDERVRTRGMKYKSEKICNGCQVTFKLRAYSDKNGKHVKYSIVPDSVRSIQNSRSKKKKSLLFRK